METMFTPVQYIKGVGPKRAESFARLGIRTVYDLLWHLPREYQDRRHVLPLNEAREGEVMVAGELQSLREVKTRRISLIKGELADETGFLTAVWFNQRYLLKVLKPGTRLLIRGRINYGPAGREVNVTEHEVLSEWPPSGPGLVPVYPATEGLPQRVIREAVGQALETFLPSYPESLEEHDDMPLREAFRQIHFPDSESCAERARLRLALEEFVLLELAVLRERGASRRASLSGIAHHDARGLVPAVKSSLPFALTGAQERVLEQITRDMCSPTPMNRLIQGDVGSGKTVVAALAAALALGGGYQVAVMAPTEILAAQHAESFRMFLEGHGIEVLLLTGSLAARARREALAMVAAGEAGVVVGTHALIQEGVTFNNLGLAVIDEQHRFGVRQRARLANKGQNPDVLVMTATPIPRTLALTVYGDLDVSVIDELPPGRQAAKTYYVPASQLDRVYGLIRTQVNKGRQAYVVCPLVEESEKQDLQDATSLRDVLAGEVFPEFRVGLLHGRMSSEEKDMVMQSFVWGELDILVSTTVIEVGVDVPNATVMAIMHAERFGLSQLHQLRGRVGRGGGESYCLLVADPGQDEARERLRVMEATSDGFEIASFDLKLRGPGEFWGTRQHGLPDLKAADLVRDGEILEAARDLATRILEDDPDLAAPRWQPWRRQIEYKFSREEEIANN